MNKAVEELAREYAYKKVGDYNYMGYKYEAYMSGAEDVFEWLLSQPIADRMTEIEKDKVRGLHACAVNALKCSFADNIMLAKIDCPQTLLEEIFGKEMFETE